LTALGGAGYRNTFDNYYSLYSEIHRFLNVPDAGAHHQKAAFY
jgi:hypothetical protein